MRSIFDVCEQFEVLHKDDAILFCDGIDCGIDTIAKKVWIAINFRYFEQFEVLRMDDAVLLNDDEIVLRRNALRRRILLAPIQRFLVEVTCFT